jgi:hypothetical protein
MCLGREVNRALEPKAPLWQAGSLPSQLLYCSACVRACAVGVGVWGVGVGVGVGGWGWGVQCVCGGGGGVGGKMTLCGKGDCVWTSSLTLQHTQQHTTGKTG